MIDHSSDKEQDLLARVAKGDEAAFTSLFRSYYPRLLQFLSRFDRDADHVDEAIQETFIRVWTSRDRLGEIDNFRAWLFTVASREAIALIRKNLLKEKTIRRYQMNQPSFDIETPAGIADAGEIRRLVEEAIAGMPPARRRVYLLSREQGLKPAEIASRLDLSVSTVKNTLVTALTDIRKFLALHGHLFLFLLASYL